MNTKSVEILGTSWDNQRQEGKLLKPSIKYKVTLTGEERETLKSSSKKAGLQDTPRADIARAGRDS